MKIRVDDISINSNNPFKSDLLEREEEIKSLNSILLKVESPLVISIDAPWGSGKTTFIRLWCSFLKHQKLDSIYFNAWETDYANDPLIAIISALDDWVQGEIDSSYLNEFLKKAKKMAPSLAKNTATSAIKIITVNSLDLDAFIEKIVSDSASEYADKLIEAFKVQGQEIDEFKKTIAPRILKVLESKGNNQKNLLIFIDELDRCRPPYAIELLERIKHLFNIKGLVFVLSTDLSQLSHSICAVYGDKFDSRKYLQRFIDIDYSLKEANKSKYIEALIETFDFEKKLPNASYKARLLSLCKVLMTNFFHLDLRSINILLSRLNLSLNAFDREILSSEDVQNLFVLAILLILKLNDAFAYEKCKFDRTYRFEIIDRISDHLDMNSSEDSQLLENIFCSFGASWFHRKSSIDKNIFFDETAVIINRIVNKFDIDHRSRIYQNVSSNIANNAIQIDPILDKIELLSRINFKQ